MRRAIVTVAALVLVACAGTRARSALLPTMRKLWGNIRPDIVRNIDPLPEPVEQVWQDRIAVADAALRAGIHADMASIDWVELTDQAEERIREDLGQGDLVPLTAQPLLNRIEVFHDMLGKYLEAR